eukprot:symbB.v1.2.016376.t1/scaffold1244.1/size129415/3
METRFEVTCETVPGEIVAVCGSGDALGQWTVAKALPLDAGDYPIWKGHVVINSSVEYKYLIVNRSSDGNSFTLVRWEGDFPNRCIGPVGPGQQVLRHRFGDASYESKEIIESQTDAPVTDGDAPPPTSPKPQLPSSAVSRKESGILKDIPVDPAVRLTRLVRSRSGRFEDAYELREKDVLGTGMTGGVIVGKNKHTGVEVAIKILRLDKSYNVEHIKAEIQHQLAMDHPNICRLLEVYEEPTRLLLVMEKLNGPDLFDAFSKKRRYTEKDAVDIVRQILSAVAYCHRHGVCHRDLKLENFCLEDDSEHARIKMIDFGLAHSIDEFPMTDSCGTLYYAAPEVLRGNYTEQCDMWSLGVLTYILLDGRAPFMGRNDRQYRFSEERWSNVSENAKGFIRKLLQVDPTQRMTAEEAANHPWLATSASGEPAVELDASIFDGLKAFSRNNEVKRAVLAAIAPMASVEQVRKWADQFEKLDENGTGQIKVKDLVQKVAQQSGEEEAESINQVLKLTADASQEISYSAFLAACLFQHHSNLEEDHLRQLFSKLDKEKKGKVTVEEISKALDGMVDLDGLESDFGSREMSFTDFRWLLHRPLTPSSLVGLRQLLGLYEDSGIAKSWRLDTIRAKAGDDDDVDAKRRENAAWRQWHRARLRGETDVSEESEVKVYAGYSAPGVLSPAPVPTGSSPGSHTTSINLAPVELLPPSKASSRCPSRSNSKQPSPSGSPRQGDENVEMTPKELSPQALTAAWQVATAEAKDGGVEAARRENRAWRLMGMEKAGNETPS